MFFKKRPTIALLLLVLLVVSVSGADNRYAPEYPGIKTKEGIVVRDKVTEINFTGAIVKTSKEMVLVKHGTFRMGADDSDASINDKPVRKVTLTRDFLIGKYEETVGEFREFITDTGYITQAEKNGNVRVFTEQTAWKDVDDASWKNPYYDQTDKHPVVCVSWHDAIAYCNWKSTKEGLEPCYSFGDSVYCDFNRNGYRLPTEAEWEYAARGGEKSKGYIYAGSNSLEKSAWSWPNSGKGVQVHPGGLKIPNELGIYDMSGNVQEWCWNVIGNSTDDTTPVTDPVGDIVDTGRIHRGGNWSGNAECRVSFHDGCYGYAASSGRGFRVVRTVK